jgi:6-phosphogluconolactonase
VTTLTVQRFASRAALDAALEQRLAAVLAAPAARALMLAGGTTPLPAYRALARRAPPAPATGLTVLFSDERYVPSDAAASNYQQARPLLDALALPPAQVLRVRTELPLQQAALVYEQQLAGLLESGTPLAFGILGLGADGHTASLFTVADLERAQSKLAIAVQRPDGMAAVSVTPRLLAQVQELAFVVAGAGKEQALQALMAADGHLTAWRAVQDCARVALWLAEDT